MIVSLSIQEHMYQLPIAAQQIILKSGLKRQILVVISQISVAQEFRSALTGRFWLGVSHEDAVGRWLGPELLQSFFTHMSDAWAGKKCQSRFVRWAACCCSHHWKFPPPTPWCIFSFILFLSHGLQQDFRFYGFFTFHVKFILKYFIIIPIANEVFSFFIFIFFSSIKKSYWGI